MSSELLWVSRNAPRLEALAGEGIYIGSSSWKYDGWRGMVYPEIGGGGRGDDAFLKHYSQAFPTVCADFTFYRYYDGAVFRNLAAATPDDFVFALKVPQSLLIDRYPAWFKGPNAGKENREFLDPEIFETRFLKPARELGGKLGPVILEFGEKTTSLSPDELKDRLDKFLRGVSSDVRYAIEVRRKSYLTGAYFEMLSARSAAHVLNSQQSAPSLREQIEKMPVFTAQFSVVRALTPPKISYKKSLEMAEPFDKIVLEYDEGVGALSEIVARCRKTRTVLFAYINNRLEGCAPLTIERLLDRIETE